MRKGTRIQWLSAALVALALGVSGCAAQGEDALPERTPETTPGPSVAPTDTPEPEPTNTPAPTKEPMPVTVGGRTLSRSALTAQGKTMLPLVETMEALSYKASVNELTEDEGKRRVHTFKKGQEEVAVSYHLQDNTVSDISFARDKLIVPVDRLLVFEDDTIFAPANFFEETTGVYVNAENGSVSVTEEQAQAGQ